MNIKSELALLAVRYLSAKTEIFPNPNSFDELTSVLFTGQTIEQRRAQEIVKMAETAANKLKTARTNRKFKKIVQNV